MSDHRLRQGRKVGRTLYEQSGAAPADADPIVGMVDTAELAAEIVAAVNARRAVQPVAETVRAAVLATLQRLHPDVRPQGTGDALTLSEDADAITQAVVGSVAAEVARERDRADDEAEAARSARESVLLMRRQLDQAAADLDHAYGWWWDQGEVSVARRDHGEGYRVSWADPDAPPTVDSRLTEDHPVRAAALARARRLAGEAPVDDD